MTVAEVAESTGIPARTIEDGGQEISLRRRDGSTRAHVLVDGADFEWLSQWRWCLSAQGYAYRLLYLGGGQRNQKRRALLMHRLLLGLEHGDPHQGDHRNGDRLDCRRRNLRVVTLAQNAQNLTRRRQGSLSRFRGVAWDKEAGRWMARANLNGRAYHLGRFDREKDAAAVAAAWRAEHMPYSAEGIA